MATTGPFGVGIIGAGNISDQYLTNLTQFPDVRVIAIGDLLEDRAREQAAKYGVPHAGGIDVVLGDPDIDIVVNLTIPAVHVEVSEAIIAAGKHVWTEKPIGVDRESSLRLLEKADAAGLRVGVAPDTVLGPGIQTAKRAIARGDIGRPLFAQTSFQWQGPEIFHPNPAFLYAVGGGPLLDMGPYYVSALVHVFGPVAAVAALGLRGSESRVVQVGPLAGEEFPVEIPSTVSVLMQFEAGRSGAGPLQHRLAAEASRSRRDLGHRGHHRHPRSEHVRRRDHDHAPAHRGGRAAGAGRAAGDRRPAGGRPHRPRPGLLDMARSIRADRPHVATGRFGYHVLDTLLSIEESVEARQFVPVASTLDEVGSLAADFDPFAATL